MKVYYDPETDQLKLVHPDWFGLVEYWEAWIEIGDFE